MPDKTNKTPSMSLPKLHAGPQSLGDFLLAIVDFGLICVLMLAPWFMGGRHPLGELVLVVTSVVVALAWVTRQALSRDQTVWKISACELLLLAAAAFVILQLTPLPSNVVQSVSPHLTKLLPLWMPETQPPDAFGTWTQLSLTPDATRAGLVMFLCYALIFVVTLQRLETIADIEHLLRWFAISAMTLAGVGLLQYLTSNGKFLWVYDHPFRDTYDAVKGPFINKNHFAHLLALGLGPLVWSVHRAVKRVQAARDPAFGENSLTTADLEWLVMVHMLGLGLVMFAGLMTLSRGGAVAMFASLAVSGVLLYRIGAIGSRFVVSFGIATMLIGGALAIHGYQRVSERLDDLTAGSIAELDQHGFRRSLWKADLAGARDFAAVGTGIGSHRDVYRLYLPEAWDVEMTHAENGYLQVALESGLPGLTMLLAGICLAAYWCLESLRSTKNQRNYVAAAAITAGLVASVLHSWADFVWYIPSCMAATVLLLACACRLMELSRDGRERWVWIHWQISRPSLAAAVAIVLLMGGWMIQNRFRASLAAPHWDQYMAFVCAPGNEYGKLAPNEALLDELRSVVKWTPDDSRAHSALARLALKRFEEIQLTSANPFPVNQIRDSAMRSRFPTRQALDKWLAGAIGEHRKYLDEALRHTRSALANGPLQGEAYLYLAELCFLENAVPETMNAYVNQALAVRPFSGDVLIAAGKEAAFAGDWDRAIELWRKAFDIGPAEQQVLVEAVSAAGVGPKDFMEIFQPGWPGIAYVYRAYSQIAAPQEVLLVRNAYLNSAKAALPKMSRAEAAATYFGMYEAFAADRDATQAIDALQQAIEANPNRIDYRRTLASELVRLGDYAGAETQLKWCLQRAPDNRELKQVLADVVKQRVASGGSNWDGGERR